METTPEPTPDPTPEPTSGGRLASRVRWGSIGLVLVGLFALMRKLPVERWIEALQVWLDGFGLLGILIFVGVYTAAALLFVPGSALTLAAGALFGLWWGTAAVSVASTSTAALAFLIARYLARGAVEGKASQNPRFAAIDRAIGQGGWRIIALLRLSPAVPFSLGNYLFGLTSIRFGPYVLSSWIAMLPGTFMYVYLGYIGSEGLSAAAGSEASRPLGQWILLVVGLLATAVVTVYVTRLAKRAIADQTQIDGSHGRAGERDEPLDAGPSRGAGWTRGTSAALVLALLVLGATVYAYAAPESFSSLVGGN